MPDITTDSERDASRSWRRIGWFLAIWTGSLLAWLAFAYGLRWVMEQVGLVG